MTLVIDLAPEVEAKLEQKAALLGVTIPALVATLVQAPVTEDEVPKKPSGAAAVLEISARLRATIPDEEFAKISTDWAMNKNKYRFGTTEEEEK